MSKKNKTSPIPFPKEVFIQNSLEDGTGSDENWLTPHENEGDVVHGVRVGVYKLMETIVIEKTETFTRKKAK